MSSYIHQAFCITELVRNICQHLEDDRASLAVLARTSKAFHEPAVGSLWYRLPNLVPLVKCLPPDAWKVDYKTISLTRTLHPADWAAFLKYSALVRELGTYEGRWPKVLDVKLHDDVVIRLAGLRPTLVLFPNVENLNWLTIELEAEALQYLLSMIGDRLKTMFIRHWPGGEKAERLLIDCLPLIASRSSTLRELWITPGTADPRASIAFSSFVSNLATIHTLEANAISITAEAAVALCGLPTLRRLSVWLADGAKWPSGGNTRVTSTSLTRIELYTTRGTYSAFSRAVFLPNLEELILKINGDPDTVSELFNSIRRQCSPQALRYIDVDTEDWGRLSVASQRTTVVRSEDFRILFDFTEVTEFSFSAECRHALDDALFVSMAEAWPKLFTLSVSCAPYCAYDTLPTFRALIHLAVHVPKLYFLGIHFDAHSWKDFTDWDEEALKEAKEHETPRDEFFGELSRRASTSELRSLYVGTSPVEQPRTVAYILARIFPHLERVKADPIEDVEETVLRAHNRKRWHEVQRMLPLFGKLRLE
ncbi:hypothetical protein K466DRAFT_538637 [Polyporus arcularius HHB13444]|uniref:F-box domain-containing protein n=1 Tax=Polyporus arcularius HHB13444 TaxID=1314778 RepID=A0A5C3PWK1_9APHY|nr:hypothetical protein K466DRAFT_538637 [Polyporus arcularius HHB13444]